MLNHSLEPTKWNPAIAGGGFDENNDGDEEELAVCRSLKKFVGRDGYGSGGWESEALFARRFEGKHTHKTHSTNTGGRRPLNPLFYSLERIYPLEIFIAAKKHHRSQMKPTFPVRLQLNVCPPATSLHAQPHEELEAKLP